jgi:uncharacterized protein (TIGR00369 family)
MSEGTGPEGSASEHDRAVFDESPFLRDLNVELVERGEGTATLAVTICERHLRTRGIAHGGLVSTLLDTAMGIAVRTGAPEGHFAVTAQLNVNFLRPAWEGERLIVTGQVRHRGMQTSVAQGHAKTERGASVAISSGTFMFVRKPADGAERLPKQPD